MEREDPCRIIQLSEVPNQLWSLHYILMIYCNNFVANCIGSLCLQAKKTDVSGSNFFPLPPLRSLLNDGTSTSLHSKVHLGELLTFHHPTSQGNDTLSICGVHLTAKVYQKLLDVEFPCYRLQD